MAKNDDKKLYGTLRAQGVRKRTARLASQMSAQLDGEGRVPKTLKDVIGDLHGALEQLEERVEAHDRKAAGRKAARTRQRKAKQRKAKQTRAGAKKTAGMRTGTAT
jgi:hypothetical protein